MDARELRERLLQERKDLPNRAARTPRQALLDSEERLSKVFLGSPLGIARGPFPRRLNA